MIRLWKLSVSIEVNCNMKVHACADVVLCGSKLCKKHYIIIFNCVHIVEYLNDVQAQHS